MSNGQESPASWAQRNKALTLPGLYIAAAVALAVIGRTTGSDAILNVLVLMGQPLMSMSMDTIGAWPATFFGVIVNAVAIGWLLQSFGRFGGRMENMGDFAVRVMTREKE